MNKKDKGLVNCEVQSTYTPGQLKFPFFIFPDTLQRVEREEAAARIVYFSQQCDKWVGVSWNKILDMMRTEFERKEAEIHNWNEQFRVHREQKIRFWRGVFTFGIYLFFTQKPMAAQLHEVSKDESSFTQIIMHGPRPIIKGIYELIRDGFLRHKKVDDEDFFIPTNKLADAISKFAIA